MQVYFDYDMCNCLVSVWLPWQIQFHLDQKVNWYPGPRGFLLFFIGKFCDANRFGWRFDQCFASQIFN